VSVRLSHKDKVSYERVSKPPGPIEESIAFTRMAAKERPERLESRGIVPAYATGHSMRTREPGHSLESSGQNRIFLNAHVSQSLFPVASTTDQPKATRRYQNSLFAGRSDLIVHAKVVKKSRAQCSRVIDAALWSPHVLKA
jgi:hypothetical protein